MQHSRFPYKVVCLNSKNRQKLEKYSKNRETIIINSKNIPIALGKCDKIKLKLQRSGIVHGSLALNRIIDRMRIRV